MKKTNKELLSIVLLIIVKLDEGLFDEVDEGWGADILVVGIAEFRELGELFNNSVLFRLFVLLKELFVGLVDEEVLEDRGRHQTL